MGVREANVNRSVRESRAVYYEDVELVFAVIIWIVWFLVLASRSIWCWNIIRDVVSNPPLDIASGTIALASIIIIGLFSSCNEGLDLGDPAVCVTLVGLSVRLCCVSSRNCGCGTDSQIRCRFLVLLSLIVGTPGCDDSFLSPTKSCSLLCGFGVLLSSFEGLLGYFHRSPDQICLR